MNEFLEKRDYLYSDFSLDGLTIDEAIEKLKSLESEVFDVKGYDAKIEYDYFSGDSWSMNVGYTRLETDHELAVRLDLEKMLAENQAKATVKSEAAERREYRRLRKKYGGKK